MIDNIEIQEQSNGVVDAISAVVFIAVFVVACVF